MAMSRGERREERTEESEASGMRKGIVREVALGTAGDSRVEKVVEEEGNSIR